MTSLNLPYSGYFNFPGSFTLEVWAGLLSQFGLEATLTAMMTNPSTGDSVEIRDPPNLLAIARRQNGEVMGIIRSSRFSLTGESCSDEPAGVDFEGNGPEFKELVSRIHTYLQGEDLVIY